MVATVSLVLAVNLSACTPTTPLVPQELVTAIEQDGRERTYDLAWQNTRLVIDIVEREAFDELEPVALELSARLHRLERARAGNMADRTTARTVTQIERDTTARSTAGNIEALVESAHKALITFDEGDFPAAKYHALEVLVIARWLSGQQ